MAYLQRLRVPLSRVAMQSRVFAASYHEKVGSYPTNVAIVSTVSDSCVQVIEHYENPRNVGSMNKEDSDVGTGLVGAPACGDVMKLQVSLVSAD